MNIKTLLCGAKQSGLAVDNLTVEDKTIFHRVLSMIKDSELKMNK
ncbi:hypothetical protein P4T70_26435 [Bacillus mobilis]|nr:hypothetical protein [Bacillus mobilis]